MNAERIYNAMHLSNEEATKRRMIADALIAFLLDWDPKTETPTDAARQTLIKAVLPYLGTKDPALRKELDQVLGWAVEGHGDKTSYKHFETYLKNNTNELPESLVTYMYDAQPQAAALSMACVYGNKGAEDELADKLKGDPKAVLQSLADRPEWWARLYAAEVMSKNPQLSDPAVVERLEQDANPLVRTIISGTRLKQSRE